MSIIFIGTISKSTENKQVLDKLQVERERGITVKAQVSKAHNLDWVACGRYTTGSPVALVCGNIHADILLTFINQSLNHY